LLFVPAWVAVLSGDSAASEADAQPADHLDALPTVAEGVAVVDVVVVLREKALVIGT
jgi:hypothetical protein